LSEHGQAAASGQIKCKTKVDRQNLSIHRSCYGDFRQVCRTNANLQQGPLPVLE
jgi:hypothetical protein